jgi:hypothetical protein
VTQYLLSIYQPDGPTPPAEFLDPIMEKVGKVAADLHASGKWVFGGGLTPADSSTTVHVKDGRETMTDGPYIEGKEHLGGLNVIEVEDLDEALAWARRFSEAMTLPIEVRALQG